MRQFPVFRRAIAEVLAPFFEVAKELLDAHRGRKCDEDASRSRTVVDKRVRNPSRSEDRVAWPQPKPLIADFDDVLSGEAIEPLVLLFVVVLGWTGSVSGSHERDHHSASHWNRLQGELGSPVIPYDRPSHGFAERSAKDHVAQEVSIVDEA